MKFGAIQYIARYSLTSKKQHYIIAIKTLSEQLVSQWRNMNSNDVITMTAINCHMYLIAIVDSHRF